MTLQVLQRPHWHGTPIELGDLFLLQKNRRQARAALFTHQLGWEVRLLVGSQLEVVQTQVCREDAENTSIFSSEMALALGPTISIRAGIWLVRL